MSVDALAMDPMVMVVGIEFRVRTLLAEAEKARRWTAPTREEA